MTKAKSWWLLLQYHSWVEGALWVRRARYETKKISAAELLSYIA